MKRIFGLFANFVLSTLSTGHEIMKGSLLSTVVKIYRCGRCDSPIGNRQRKCYACKAFIDWR